MKFLSSVGLILLCASSLAASKEPSVVILYGDDVGFADIGVNGAKLIPTGGMPITSEDYTLPDLFRDAGYDDGTIAPGASLALVSHTDFIGSFAQLLDVDLPEGAAPDGLNSFDALFDGGGENRYLLQETGHNLALRDGDWKLIRFSNRKPTNNENIQTRYVVYNLCR